MEVVSRIEARDSYLFTEDPAIVPLEEVAHQLATKDDWPDLYDAETLATSHVPAAAAVYLDDMFVPAELSMKTAGAINGLRPWAANAYQHDGIRTDGATIFERLLKLVRDQI